MSQKVFDAAQLAQKHERSTNARVITQYLCWSVVFDTNGNAPEDATVVSCATEELAKQALFLFAAKKDTDQITHIVVGGEKHSVLPTFSVEGYEHDTFFCVREDWQEAKDIITSLAELTKLAEELETTDEPDGVFLTFCEE